MLTVTMTNRLNLLQIESGYGHDSETKIVKSQRVWGKADDISTTAKLNSQSLGVKTDLTVTVWRSEFVKAPYTHIDFDGLRYKIVATGKSANSLYIKLTLERV